MESLFIFSYFYLSLLQQFADMSDIWISVAADRLSNMKLHYIVSQLLIIVT